MSELVKLLVWLIKLPFVLLVAVLAAALWLVGAILALLGLALTPVLGVGLLILPIGLALILAAGIIARLCRRRTIVVEHR